MTYRELIETLQKLPAEALDRQVTAHFRRTEVVFPVVRVAMSGEVLKGHKALGMMGNDLPILTSARAKSA